MKVVTGHVTTYSKDGAAAARFAFYDYLDVKHPAVEFYASFLYPGEYRFEFTRVPEDLWLRFNRVWIGDDAVYPGTVGCCAIVQLLEPK